MKKTLLLISITLASASFSQIKVPKVGAGALKVGKVKDQIDAGDKLIPKKFSDQDVGTLDFVSTNGSIPSYELGSGPLDAKFSLPMTIKEYEMKYNNSSLESGYSNIGVYAFLNGEKLIAYDVNVPYEDLTKSKEYILTIVPESDKDITSMSSKAHNQALYHKYKSQNSVMMLFLANAYNKLPEGKHKLEIELRLSRDDKTEPTLAKNSIEINITAEGRKKLATWSSVPLPTHFPEYEKEDKVMLSKVKKDLAEYGVEVYDFFRKTEFQYFTDTWGNFTHRVYSSDFLIKADGVCWFIRNIKYSQPHIGGNNYGSEKRSEGHVTVKTEDADKTAVPIPCSRLK
jgi:hypothetical protein